MKLFGRINHYRADPTGWIGSVVMFSFAVFSFYRWQKSGLIFFLLLILRELSASYFLLTRNPSEKNNSNKWASMLAYVSSAWPFFYLSSTTDSPTAHLIDALLAIIGFLLSTWALFDLGKSFGVAPANRGIIRTGVYSYFEHPMYLGYVISESGFVVLNPWNGILWVLSVLLYFLRSRIENKVLAICKD